MRSNSYLFPLIISTLFGGCVSATTGGGAPEAEGVVNTASLDPPPIYALLGYRAELGLNSTQIAKLDSIAEAARLENQRLVRELMQRSEGGTRQRGVVRPGPEGQPVLDEIRRAQRQTSEAVADLLTPDQREEICGLFDRTRPRPGEGQPAGMAGGRGRPTPGEPPPMSNAPDTPRTGARPAGPWSWCAGAEGSAP